MSEAITTKIARVAPAFWSQLLILSLFITATGGAWAWYHVNPPEIKTFWEFAPKAQLGQAHFTPIPVGQEAMEMLSSTNLINGRFVYDDKRQFTVFFGDWRARSAREMNVVQHTPDICWVGAGWTVVDKNLPSKVDLSLDGHKVPFVCRVFGAPRGDHQELTLWCTLVGGQLYDEGERFASEQDAEEKKEIRKHASARRRALEQFTRAVQHRIASDGSKQFARFSTTIRGDPVRSLTQLVEFGERWLELKSTERQKSMR